jgi:hypothetical protein
MSSGARVYDRLAHVRVGILTRDASAGSLGNSRQRWSDDDIIIFRGVA